MHDECICISRFPYNSTINKPRAIYMLCVKLVRYFHPILVAFSFLQFDSKTAASMWMNTCSCTRTAAAAAGRAYTPTEAARSFWPAARESPLALRRIVVVAAAEAALWLRPSKAATASTVTERARGDPLCSACHGQQQWLQ